MGLIWDGRVIPRDLLWLMGEGIERTDMEGSGNGDVARMFLALGDAKLLYRGWERATEESSGQRMVPSFGGAETSFP